MTWQQVSSRVPTSIGHAMLIVASSSDNEASFDYSFDVVVLDQNGIELKRMVVPLADLLNQGQKNQLANIYAAVRTRAVDDLLP